MDGPADEGQAVARAHDPVGRTRTVCGVAVHRGGRFKRLHVCPSQGVRQPHAPELQGEGKAGPPAATSASAATTAAPATAEGGRLPEAIARVWSRGDEKLRAPPLDD